MVILRDYSSRCHLREGGDPAHLSQTPAYKAGVTIGGGGWVTGGTMDK